MMVAFIDAHREAYGVEPICAVVPIAPSVYYERKARERVPERRPARARRDEALTVEVERVWREHHAVYGVRKVWKQLRGRATRSRAVRWAGSCGGSASLVLCAGGPSR
jgi:putative transposase